MQASQLVLSFLEAWEKAGGWRNALSTCFTPDCVYENVGLSKTIGPLEAIAFVEGFNSKLPFVTMTVQMHHIVESANIVMTERIDRFQDESGAEIFSLAVMGVFEVRGDKISGWRDYFDASAFKR